MTMPNEVVTDEEVERWREEARNSIEAGVLDGGGSKRILRLLDDRRARTEALEMAVQALASEWEPPPGPPSVKPTKCPEGHDLMWLTKSVASCGTGRPGDPKDGCAMRQLWLYDRSGRRPKLKDLLGPIKRDMAFRLLRSIVAGRKALATAAELGIGEGEE